MLDPELIDQLAAQPEKNAPAVNVALAEEGAGTVLLALARSGATASDALEVIHQRMMQTVALKQAELEVVIEARDQGHVREIVGALRSSGFRLRTDSGI